MPFNTSKQPTRRICLLAPPQSQILDIAGPLEVFAKANRFAPEQAKGGRPPYDIQVVATTANRRIVCNNGLSLQAHLAYREVRGAVDTLLVAGGDAVETGGVSRELLRWLRRMANRLRRLGSICTGAYLLAEAGLLDGCRATTHWGWCQDLSARYPKVRMENDPIFVRDGKVYTSAGVTAGMDMALAMVEEDLGAALALRIARHLVVFLRRPGNQSQFSAALSQQMADRTPLRELQECLPDHLHLPLTVEQLAERAGMSPRNFARVFAQQSA
jgi:transcriptional regulator GlxA family with amidase domain